MPRRTKRRPSKRPPHRPTKYSDDMVKRLTGAIAIGDTVEEACKRVDLTPTTFYEWLNQRPEFAEAVQTAKTARLDVLEERWAKATLKDWRAAEAMLRVLKPKQFAQRIRVHVAEEIEGVLDALAEAFKDEPHLYERALHAVVGRAEPEENPPAASAAPDAALDGRGESVTP